MNQLPDLPLLFLTFHLRAREAVVLPPFLGSTLRGAFGAALKRVFCFVPPGECARCWFFEACPYQYIFESPNLIPNFENHPKLRGQKNLPHPFVLIPPVPRLKNQPSESHAGKPDFNDDYVENRFAVGETLGFSILLIGKATAFWTQVLAAARILAEDGLGANRAAFDLFRAFAGDRNGQPVEIYNEREPRVAAAKVAPVSLASAVNLHTRFLLDQLDGDAKHLKIEFLTPARIRVADELPERLDAATIFKKITERIEFLARVHAAPPQRNDYREVVESAKNSLRLDGSVKLYRYEQFSNRQHKKTSRDVMTANLALDGREIAAYLPFLTAGEILHIGANTSDGFGRFAVKIGG